MLKFDPSTTLQKAKEVIDMAAVLAAFKAFFDTLPTLLLILTIIWTLIRLFQEPTIQGWLKSRKERKLHSRRKIDLLRKPKGAPKNEN